MRTALAAALIALPVAAPAQDWPPAGTELRGFFRHEVTVCSGAVCKLAVEPKTQSFHLLVRQNGNIDEVSARGTVTFVSGVVRKDGPNRESYSKQSDRIVIVYQVNDGTIGTTTIAAGGPDGCSVSKTITVPTPDVKVVVKDLGQECRISPFKGEMSKR